MTKEQLDHYKRVGDGYLQAMKDCRDDKKIKASIDDSALADNLVVQIKSGLHPCHIADVERAELVKKFGEKWYEKWGYVKEDLDDFVTFEPKLQ